MSTHLAIDIGGSHGRAVLGVFEEGAERFADVGQFSTDPVWIGGQLCWDLEGMLDGIRSAMAQAARRTDRVDTLAIDTMGLAFGLLDQSGRLAASPVYTRTAQDEAVKENIIRHFGREKLYAINGLEQQKLNSLYYLAKIKWETPELLARTAHILMLPALINYLLTGVMANEYTAATTSALWDIGNNCWSESILAYLGLSTHVPLPVLDSGVLGRLVCPDALPPALRETVVVNIPSHDTAAAFFSLPEEDQDQLLISCGTWGMLGCLLDAPVLTPDALDAGFANEGAANGRIKFLNNAPNMSVLKGCVDHWNSTGLPMDWPAVYRSAEAAASVMAYLDLYHPSLRDSSDMPEAIQMYCHSTGQQIPSTPGEISAVVLRSIARHYGLQMKKLQTLTGRRFKRGVMVGGATRNSFFLRLCREELGMPVKPASSEASIIGNLKAQRLVFNKTGTGGHSIQKSGP